LHKLEGPRVAQRPADGPKRFLAVHA
jgi:hypothetical protein